MTEEIITIKAVTLQGNVQEFRCKKLLSVGGVPYEDPIEKQVEEQLEEEDVKGALNHLDGRIQALENLIGQLVTNQSPYQYPVPYYTQPLPQNPDYTQPISRNPTRTITGE